MSRCFPFPPPGYEKKITTDETDPLIKEKYKEKKHKKDKDKEKKEGKEKKSKDRSKDKHKERKEKKEKHKDRKDKEKDKEKSKPLEENQDEVLKKAGHIKTFVTNTVQNNSNGESKYVQDLARRIRYEEEATGSQSAQKITNQKGVTGKAFENSSFCPIQGTNHKENDDKRISTQKNFGADQKRGEAMDKPVEKRDQARKTDSPEKSHCKENATKSDKPRDKEGVKKNEANDKDRYKGKKEEKTESIKKTHQEKPKLEETGNDALEDIRNRKPPDLLRASVKNFIAEGNLGKRKDLETNGFLYENGTTPNKLQRHSASVASVKNGRTLSARRTTPIPASEVQETTCKPEAKEVNINGFVVSGERQKVCPPNPLAATMKVKVKENNEASAKPPHPDLKYLNHILNVPKRELIPEGEDDQEWLYGGPLGVKLKKSRTTSPDSGESLHVWNQAFRIESADISALPYVVPF
ncbi:hypothetical protein EUTSA_v10004154mg [Eutrema salsugineum]|uniref:Uncharacterized protein n=1 Tax=Eutrema salsugineum TaxID=72664 RepID=V4MLU7_EUTSA|nr:myb-like protein X [Eutrema salsugineum]ESQ32446.1 hypothetical protein EUTSA_v10004154mg [Eutrema salsugineum]